MTGRRRLSRKIDWIFRQDEARRCSEKDTRHSFGRIFRPADDETPPLYFVYSKLVQAEKTWYMCPFDGIFCPVDGKPTKAYRVYVEEV